jgi:hypothetical protein
MKQMTPAAVERAMKLQDVMLRAMAKRITWYQAAEILGLSGRQMLRWQTRFKHEGYEGYCQLKVNIGDLTTSCWGLLPSECHKRWPFSRIFT